jgi:chromosome partitioning protein
MRILAFLNQKGGVGKTTSVINVGAGLARSSQRVLLVDMDPQASLTYSLGFQAHEIRKTVYQLMKKDILFEEAVLEKKIDEKRSLFLLPASVGLSAFEHDFKNSAGSEYVLKSVLLKKIIGSFDYVLIDCPPSLGLLTLNVLAAAHEVIIPVQTEFLALQGLSQLLDTCQVVQSGINKGLVVGGIFGTRYNRRRISHDVMDYLRSTFKKKVFKTVIRENVSLTEAPSFGQDIYSYQARSYGSVDYRSLCREIMKRETVN